jgi:hypothetical protein
MSDMWRKCSVACVGVFAAAATAGTAHGASELLNGSGWRAHFGAGLNVTLQGVSDDRAEVRIEKTADFTEPFEGGVGPTLEITFEQVDFDAVPFIVVDSESVSNQTGTDWGAFRFNLTEATNGSDEHVSFDEAKTFGDDDPLDITPFTSHTLSSDGTELIVDGGTVANGNTWTPGSGDGAGELVIFGAPVDSGTKRAFFFKEQPRINGGGQPIIPLPAAVWTGLGGLLTVGAFSKKLRKSV